MTDLQRALFSTFAAKNPNYDRACPPTNGDVWTTRDLTANDISHTIRQKPEWWLKYKNPEIVSKWRKEIVGHFPWREWQFKKQVSDRTGLTDDELLLLSPQFADDEIFQYVLDELSVFDERRLEFTPFQPGLTQKIFKGVLDDNIRQELCKAVQVLEKGPKDWHPNSNEQVLDLVHPSLYPLVYGKTPVSAGEAPFNEPYKFSKDAFPLAEIKNKPGRDVQYPRFQWLPSLVNKEGTFGSYINNLHWRNSELYSVIGKVFKQVVAGFEAVCSSPKDIRRETATEGPEYKADLWELMQKYEDDGHDDLEQERLALIERGAAKLPKFEFREPEKLERYIFGKDQKLKVIVKLANIELTPEKPKYAGGTWHIEGEVTEAIAASAIYYYDSENITQSALSFREFFISYDVPYEQGDATGVKQVFGLEDESPSYTYFGAEHTNEGECIVFPNTYQHQVQPFELADPTKSGHRKILCFFLVDPSEKGDMVVSTAQVPPQQISWMADTVAEDKVNFPPELQLQVLKEVPGLMTLEEARGIRLQLMEQRGIKTGNHGLPISFDGDIDVELQFSLCEH